MAVNKPDAVAAALNAEASKGPTAGPPRAAGPAGSANLANTGGAPSPGMTGQVRPGPGGPPGGPGGPRPGFQPRPGMPPGGVPPNAGAAGPRPNMMGQPRPGMPPGGMPPNAGAGGPRPNMMGHPRPGAPLGGVPPNAGAGAPGPPDPGPNPMGQARPGAPTGAPPPNAGGAGPGPTALAQPRPGAPPAGPQPAGSLRPAPSNAAGLQAGAGPSGAAAAAAPGAAPASQASDVSKAAAEAMKEISSRGLSVAQRGPAGGAAEPEGTSGDGEAGDGDHAPKREATPPPADRTADPGPASPAMGEAGGPKSPEAGGREAGASLSPAPASSEIASPRSVNPASPRPGGPPPAKASIRGGAVPGDGQGVATAAGAAAAARAPSLPHGAKAEAPDLLRELEAMGVDLESGLGRRLRAYCAMDVKELFRAAVKLELGVAASQERSRLDESTRRELEEMLVRLEKHVREQEEARGRAEADLERVMGQMSMGQEGRLAAEDRMREMEAELESARVEARRATALLDQAAEITRARVESEWAVRFTRAQADAETRAARLMLENQRLQQELHYRTDMMGAEMSRWKAQAEQSSKAVAEARTEVLARKKELDHTNHKLNRLMETLAAGDHVGSVLLDEIGMQLNRAQQQSDWDKKLAKQHRASMAPAPALVAPPRMPMLNGAVAPMPPGPDAFHASPNKNNGFYGSVLNAGPVGFGGAGGFPYPPPAMHGMGFGPGAMWGGMAPQMSMAGMPQVMDSMGSMELSPVRQANGAISFQDDSPKRKASARGGNAGPRGGKAPGANAGVARRAAERGVEEAKRRAGNAGRGGKGPGGDDRWQERERENKLSYGNPKNW